MQTYVNLEWEAVCCERVLLNIPPSRQWCGSGGTLNLRRLLCVKSVTVVLFADDLLVVQNSFCLQCYSARKKKGIQYTGQCLRHYLLI